LIAERAHVGPLFALLTLYYVTHENLVFEPHDDWHADPRRYRLP
jgi:hypothetical protein